MEQCNNNSLSFDKRFYVITDLAEAFGIEGLYSIYEDRLFPGRGCAFEL